MGKAKVEKTNKIVLFKSKQIRRAWYMDKWFYSLVDVIGALTDSTNPTDYLKKIRKRDQELASYLGTNCPQVEMLTSSGKARKTLAGNAKDIFRLIQSMIKRISNNLMNSIVNATGLWAMTWQVGTINRYDGK